MEVEGKTFLLSIFLRTSSCPPPPDDFMNDDMDTFLIAMDTSIAPGPSSTGPPTPPIAASVCLKQPAVGNHRMRLYSEEEDEDGQGTSEGPPNKKVKSVFT